jgi:hypothetical protein|tara:strand:- start:240 stop:719 length:480 start_codon:yes stop_codon:yes gene_type:complete
MASRVEYAVSATPIVTVAPGENTEVDTIAVDVGKSIGGSGSSTVTWGTTVGYGSGSPVYVTTATNYAVGQTATSLGTFTDAKFIFVKHSGYLFSSSSALGAATTAKLKVCMIATIAAATTVAILNAGEAIILPYNVANTATLFVAGDGVAIATEVMKSA